VSAPHLALPITPHAGYVAITTYQHLGVESDIPETLDSAVSSHNFSDLSNRNVVKGIAKKTDGGLVITVLSMVVAVVIPRKLYEVLRLVDLYLCPTFLLGTVGDSQLVIDEIDPLLDSEHPVGMSLAIPDIYYRTTTMDIRPARRHPVKEVPANINHCAMTITTSNHPFLLYRSTRGRKTVRIRTRCFEHEIEVWVALRLEELSSLRIKTFSDSNRTPSIVVGNFFLASEPQRIRNDGLKHTLIVSGRIKACPFEGRRLHVG